MDRVSYRTILIFFVKNTTSKPFTVESVTIDLMGWWNDFYILYNLSY